MVATMARHGLFTFASAAFLVSSLGLLACSKEQPAKPAAPAPAPKVEETVKEAPTDDIPPPPPEPEDSGAPTAPTTPTAPKGPAVNDVCAPKACNGQLTEELGDTLGGKCRIARRCYETELANNPDLKGRISLKVRVAGDGTLCSAKVETDETGDARLAACVASMFRGKVPSPSGGCLETVVPCNFVRGGR